MVLDHERIYAYAISEIYTEGIVCVSQGLSSETFLINFEKKIIDLEIALLCITCSLDIVTIAN